MRKGFTLIELLVVIAIIAILAAILFPVFINAKKSAQTTKCGAHGRELGMAMLLYLQDSNDTFPSKATSDMLAVFSNHTWQYDWPGSPGVETWGVTGCNEFRYIQLKSYVKSKDIWICPSPSGLYGTKYAYGYQCSWFFITAKWGYGQQIIDYPDTPFQEWYGVNDPRNGKGLKITEVLSRDTATGKRGNAPSKKIFACCYALGPDVPVEAYPGSTKMVTPYYPHKEGTIYVYLDGHAKYADTGCGWAPVGYTSSNLDRPHPTN